MCEAISSHTATWTLSPSSALASDETGAKREAVRSWWIAFAPTATPKAERHPEERRTMFCAASNRMWPHGRSVCRASASASSAAQSATIGAMRHAAHMACWSA